MKDESKSTIFINKISTQTIITIVQGVLELLVFASFSRLLSKADFGYFAALSAVLAVCMSLSEAGLGSAIIQKKNVSLDYVSTAFSLSLAIGLFCSILLFALAPMIADLVADDTITTPIRLLSSVLLLNSIISVGNAQLYRRLMFKRVGIIQIVSYALSATIGIFLAYKGYGLMSIVLYSFLYPLFIAFLLYSTSARLPKLYIKKGEVQSIVHFGGWLTLGGILNNLTAQLDKLFMSKWLSVESLGAYNRPSGFISQISGKINGIFDTVLFPMLSDIQDDQKRIISTFYRAIKLLNSFSVILSAAFFFNAELIIRIFFGEQWMSLSTIFRIVSISVVFSVDNRLVDCFFRSLNLVKTGFYLRFIAAIITFLALFIGSRYEIMGVAIGLVLANVIVIVLKMTVLCLKINASLGKMFLHWLKAMKPAIPIVIIGILFLCSNVQTLMAEIGFLIAFVIIVFIEFVIFPRSISYDYYELAFPYISKIPLLKKFVR